jgi:DNA-binding NarL/FixJ family response regulator
MSVRCERSFVSGAVTGPARVLLVDDEPMVRTSLRRLLEGRGLEVVGEAGDGVEGVERAVECRPDVVVLDVRMPRLDGLGAARRIREAVPEARIVLLTASEDPSISTSVTELQLYALVVKGSPPPTIVDVIETAARSGPQGGIQPGR